MCLFLLGNICYIREWGVVMFHVDHVFYINLDHAAERRAYVKDIVTRLGLSSISTRVSGYITKDEEIPLRFSSNTHGRRSRRRGYFGCTMSHLACYNMAKVAGYRSFIVLEDDCFLLPGFVECVKPINNTILSGDWDLIYPYSSTTRVVGCNDFGLFRSTGIRRTHFYFVNGRCLDALIFRCDPRIIRERRVSSTGNGIIDRVLEKECRDLMIFGTDKVYADQGVYHSQMLSLARL